MDEGAESVTAHQICRSGLGPEAIAGAIRTCAAVLTADEPIGCSTLTELLDEQPQCSAQAGWRDLPDLLGLEKRTQ